MKMKLGMIFTMISAMAFCGSFKDAYSKLWNEKVTVEQRTQIEDAIMEQSFNMPGMDEFVLYLHERMSDEERATIRGKYKIIDFYEDAFDRALDGLKNDVVAPGKVNLYYIYNMGFVVKTPTVAFAFDVCHPRSPELVPYLDFAAVTHNHSDHVTTKFLQAMTKANKMVINNFYSGPTTKMPYGPGYSKEPFREIVMETVTVRTYETNHLNYNWFKYNMPIEFVCKSGDKEYVIFTGGDACDTMQFKCGKRPDLAILHPRVGGNIVHGALLLDAKITFVCHLLEMQHQAQYRWPFSVGYSEQKLLLTNHLIGGVPHWGDKFVLPLELDEGNNYNLHLPKLPAAKPIRIMPVGDSITRGTIFPAKNYYASEVGGGYRLPLQKLLKQSGIEYQFVGELAYLAYGKELGYCDPDFQQFHHGLSGFSNKAIRTGGKLPQPDQDKICRGSKWDVPLTVPGIVESMARWKPDVILLMSGSNGFIPEERNLLIKDICDNFTGDLYVANIPMQKPPRDGYENVATYNASLLPFLNTLKNTKCKIHYVDMYSALTKDDISDDGVHPNQQGLNKIAKVWFDALNSPQNTQNTQK